MLLFYCESHHACYEFHYVANLTAVLMTFINKIGSKRLGGGVGRGLKLVF
jgi:hypothetical protein